MKTSAPTLFADPLMEFSGTLLHPAQARTKQLDNEGHMVPCLCMEVELDNPLRNHMRVEQLFPAEHQEQCEAAARRMKRGTRVTVQVPAIGLRLVAANTQHIHVVQEPQESTT